MLRDAFAATGDDPAGWWRDPRVLSRLGAALAGLHDGAGGRWIGVAAIVDQLDAGRRRDLNVRGLVRAVEL